MRPQYESALLWFFVVASMINFAVAAVMEWIR